MEWIKLTDRLPKENESVLTLTDGDVIEGYMKKMEMKLNGGS